MLGLGNNICAGVVPSQDAFTNGYSLLFDGATSGAQSIIIPDHASWEPTDDDEAFSLSFWLKSTRGLGASGTYAQDEFVMGCGVGSDPDGFRMKFNANNNVIKFFLHLKTTLAEVLVLLIKRMITTTRRLPALAT